MAGFFDRFVSASEGAQTGLLKGVQNAKTILETASGMDAAYRAGEQARLESLDPYAWTATQASPTPVNYNFETGQVEGGNVYGGTPMPELTPGLKLPDAPGFNTNQATTQPLFDVPKPPEPAPAPAPAPAANAPATGESGAASQTSATEPAPMSPIDIDGSQFANLSGGQLRTALAPIFTQLETEAKLPAGYLDVVASIETGGTFNPRAQSDKSTAGGLFQFIDSTARAYGLTDKTNPVASSIAAARYAQANAAELTRGLGRAPTAQELWLAHNQGAAGALALLKNPNATALSVLTRAYNGDVNLATSAIRNNGGNVNMTATQFASRVQGFFDSRANAARRQESPSGTTVVEAPEGAPFNVRSYWRPQQPSVTLGAIATAIQTNQYKDVEYEDPVFGVIKNLFVSVDPELRQQYERTDAVVEFARSKEARDWFGRNPTELATFASDPVGYFATYSNAKASGAASAEQLKQAISAAVVQPTVAAPSSTEPAASPTQDGQVVINNRGQTRDGNATTQPVPAAPPGVRTPTAPQANAAPAITAPPAQQVEWAVAQTDPNAFSMRTRQLLQEREAVAAGIEAARKATQQKVDAEYQQKQLALSVHQREIADLQRQQREAQNLFGYWQRQAQYASSTGNVTAMRRALTNLQGQDNAMRTANIALRSAETNAASTVTAIRKLVEDYNVGVASANAEDLINLNKLDFAMWKNFGMEAANIFANTNDPTRLSQVWQQFSGQKIDVQPRSDGKYNLLINGQPIMATDGTPYGYQKSEISRKFFETIDSEMAAKFAQADSARQSAVFESGLKINEQIVKDLGALRLEELKQQFETGRKQLEMSGWKIEKQANGDGYIIWRPDTNQFAIWTPDPGETEDGVKLNNLQMFNIGSGGVRNAPANTQAPATNAQ